MSLSFLPKPVKDALNNLNYNFISEIRLRRGQPVIIEYKGEYKYINSSGLAEREQGLITAGDIEQIFNEATKGCVYNYSEQMKSGFITVEHGVRIGIAGEYVTQNGQVQTIRNLTSLNVRIPHNILGCSDFIIKNLFLNNLKSTLIFSKPGYGKTTILRDLAINLGKRKNINVLIFDERNEISAIDAQGNGFDFGDRVDIIRCHNKNASISSAIRSMKPQLIITDELYGEEDIKAIEFAVNCGICVIASSHITNKEILKKMPFVFYVELLGVGITPVIYDKNFNPYCGGNTDRIDRGNVICK